MEKLKQEINHTITAMQADICESAHKELRNHLSELLYMVRSELQCLIMEDSWDRGGKGIDSNEKPASAIVEPYKSVRIGGDSLC